jgi:hypothetical protein
LKRVAGEVWRHGVGASNQDSSVIFTTKSFLLSHSSMLQS